MAISEVIEFEGKVDQLVWKSPVEDFNTTSILIVPDTHVALLVINGNACDLFRGGRHTLETPNIPLAKRLINIPTGGKTSFPCQVYYINKLHQMDMTWGIPGEITLDDPKYDIFLHIGMCGNMNFRINDEGARPFMMKIVGFRDKFNPDEMVAKFRGIIKQYVKAAISKIMNVGKVSYFDMNENLFEVSKVVKEQLIPIFLDYGVDVMEFNIETITVPDEDFAAVKKAKERRSSRIIEGYSWTEEKQMEIANTLAGNQGTLGGMSGAVGGIMLGGMLGGSVADIARNALNQDNIPKQAPPKDLSGIASPMGNPTETKTPSGQKFCNNCGHPLVPGAKFCDECGTKVISGNICANCGYVFTSEMKFCPECGAKRV
ncbi:MAG: SPFH domain-containing protein [Lachnospiraceae bacterium]|nr:SPFH domain-containing protein [Lachnospiraceae bacterium]